MSTPSNPRRRAPENRRVLIDGVTYLVTVSDMATGGPYQLRAWAPIAVLGCDDQYATVASHGTDRFWGMLGSERNGPYRSLPPMSDARIKAALAFNALTAQGARAVIAAAFPEAGVVVEPQPRRELQYTADLPVEAVQS